MQNYMGIIPHKVYALGKTLPSAFSVPGASVLVCIGSALPSYRVMWYSYKQFNLRYQKKRARHLHKCMMFVMLVMFLMMSFHIKAPAKLINVDVNVSM